MARRPLPPAKQWCQRCGRGIPARRADTGFCSAKCDREQAEADAASAAAEEDYLRQQDCEHDVDDGDYIAERVAARDDVPPSPFD